MKAKLLPNLKYLQECFELSEESSSGLVWKVRPDHHFAVGRSAQINSQFSKKSAGHLITHPNTGKQYWRVFVAGSSYATHRIIYSMFHNIDLPEAAEIDHKDGNSLNNKQHNLRLAVNGENQHNVDMLKSNTSGVKGVFWCKVMSAWRGRLYHKNKSHHLGYSPSKEAMEEIVREARQELHKEFANHG